jgi:hypothetical protein
MACAHLTPSDTGDGSRQDTIDRGVILTYGVSKMSAYARLKRYRQKRSLEREAMYLAKCWPRAGGPLFLYIEKVPDDWLECLFHKEKALCLAFRQCSEAR